jgi:hypothetical protein
MVASVILVVVMAALLMTLQIGELVNGIGSAKVDLESETRMLVDWITKDVRQAKIQELCNNTPATDFIRFNLWEGQWNVTGYVAVKTAYYVEYEYDPGAGVLHRRFIDTSLCWESDSDYPACTIRNEWNFTGISLLDPDTGSETGKGVFYTSYSRPTDNGFNSTVLLNNRKIIVVIKKEKTVRNRLLNFTLAEEVKIRNE